MSLTTSERSICGCALNTQS